MKKPAKYSYEQQNIFLDALALIITMFLKKHGGISNGYDTWVKGEISLDSIASLNIRIPSYVNKTPRQMDKLCQELMEKLKEIMKKFGIKRIRISNQYKEWECYETFIEIVNQRRVNLI